MSGTPTREDLLKMLAQEIEWGKQKDNLYLNPAPEMQNNPPAPQEGTFFYENSDGEKTSPSGIAPFNREEPPPRSTTTTTTTYWGSSTTSSTTSTTSSTTSTTSSTTTLEPTTTTTTSSSTTTTTTTLEPTTTSTTSSTTTSTTLEPTTSSTTSTSSTTTSTSSTTTTTTTLEPSGDQAKFNFNLTAQSIAGWKDVTGSPHSGVVSATDDINGTGYTISSISGKWGNFGGSANNANGSGIATSDFPSTVMQSFWYNYSMTYPANGACLVLSSLLPNTSYELKMIGSRSSTLGGGIPEGQNRIMEFDVSQVATISDASEQTNQNYIARDSTTTQTFVIDSNSSGEIYIGVYQSRTGDETNNDRFGFINGLIVTQL